MGRRIDYYDDPNAPQANSLVPSVNVVVTNDAGQILLIKRSDNDNWAVPGGAVLALPVAWKFVHQVLAEAGEYQELTHSKGV